MPPLRKSRAISCFGMGSSHEPPFAIAVGQRPSSHLPKRTGCVPAAGEELHESFGARAPSVSRSCARVTIEARSLTLSVGRNRNDASARLVAMPGGREHPRHSQRGLGASQHAHARRHDFRERRGGGQYRRHHGVVRRAGPRPGEGRHRICGIANPTRTGIQASAALSRDARTAAGTSMGTNRSAENR